MNWQAIASNPLVWTIACALLLPIAIKEWQAGWKRLIAWTVARRMGKTAALEGLIESAGEAVLTAIGQGKDPQDALAHGKAAVLQQYAAGKGVAVEDLGGAVGETVEAGLRLKANIAPTVPATELLAGNVTANAPLLKSRVLVLVLALLIPFHAQAQIAPPVADHWEAGILVPGLKFSLAGASPAAVGAGSGVGFSYLFGKYLYTTKQVDPVTKAPITLPWFGVTFFAQGDVSVLLSGTVSENENAGVGAGFILLNSVTLGWFVDLVSVGSGVTSGLFTNHLSLSNTGPEVFYSVNLGAL
jgi:hypothetical protein